MWTYACEPRCPRKPEVPNAPGAPGDRVLPWMNAGEPTVGPLQEQQRLFTVEPPLQPLLHTLIAVYLKFQWNETCPIC